MGLDETGDRPFQTARWAALRVLSDLREGRQTAKESIDELAGRAPLPPQERGLATELIMGVIRHRLTLARVLGAYAVHGWQRVSRRLQHVLMIGAYQLIWLDGVPAFAAVNEAVEQARAEGGLRAAKFVNAILRQLLRDVEHPRLPRDQADATRAIPVNGRECLQLKRAVLTEPKDNPTAYLAEATSHPTWLVGRWIRHYGREAAEAACRAGMSRPVTMLRPNRLRVDARGLVERLKAEGFAVELAPAGGVVVAEHAGGLMRSEAFAGGLFQPQDSTAKKAVEQMNLSPGQAVVDLCAGVGTKTTQMAEIMQNRGTILATDKDGGRLELLRANCTRLGVGIVRTMAAGEAEAAVGELARVDWILVDAPCSNTGVLSRRPEARYRVDGRALAGLAGVQKQMLDLAAKLARPETRLLYSTCSLEPEENEQVAMAFAAEHAGWAMTGSELTLPSADGPAATWRDGGYWCAWRQGVN